MSDRVVVFGSLPPHGRDLDLLARPPEETSLAAALADAGFERRGQVWACFDDCSARVVDVTPAEALHLPDAELDALFEEARPIEPAGRVCQPAPYHALLIGARRAVREGPRLKAKRRDRVAAELAEDPRAFELARKRASMWGASRSLAALEAAHRLGRPMPVGLRQRAVAQELRSSRGPLSAWIGASRAVLRRPRRGVVIALSGLDGSGKSSQAADLAETLDRLGHEAVVAWASIAFHPPWLGRVGRAVKRWLAAWAQAIGRSTQPDLRSGAPRGADDPGTLLRSGSSTLTFAWSLLLTAVLAVQVARRVWPGLLRGQVVVCDRYALDAWTHLAYQYGEERRFRAQLALIRAAFPRPRLAYLLDVPPELAASRKREFDAAQNQRRAAIYRRRASELGVRVLDGDRPPAELCAELARDAWAALS